MGVGLSIVDPLVADLTVWALEKRAEFGQSVLSTFGWYAQWMAAGARWVFAIAGNGTCLMVGGCWKHAVRGYGVLQDLC